MTIQNKDYPHYEGRPVILVHMTVNPSSSLAWCAPIEYMPDTEGSYPNIPRVLCPACIKASQ